METGLALPLTRDLRSPLAALPFAPGWLAFLHTFASAFLLIRAGKSSLTQEVCCNRPEDETLLIQTG
jgi:hypothetical protein